MPTEQLVDLIIDHSVAFVALTLAVERAVFAVQPILEGEWFYFSQQFLDSLDRLPTPKITAATLTAVVLRSIFHIVIYYLQ